MLFSVLVDDGDVAGIAEVEGIRLMAERHVAEHDPYHLPRMPGEHDLGILYFAGNRVLYSQCPTRQIDLRS